MLDYSAGALPFFRAACPSLHQKASHRGPVEVSQRAQIERWPSARVLRAASLCPHHVSVKTGPPQGFIQFRSSTLRAPHCPGVRDKRGVSLMQLRHMRVHDPSVLEQAVVLVLASPRAVALLRTR